MIEHIVINVNFYGHFRQYLSEDVICLRFKKGITVKKFKELFFENFTKRVPTFSDKKLLEVSAIARGDSILANDVCLTENCSITLLPPVCGG